MKIGLKECVWRVGTLCVVSMAGASIARAAVSFGGHEYLLTSAEMTWAQAEAEAIGLGGHLVAINSAAEQAFLETTFNDVSAAPFYRWIGLTDEGHEGTWTWTSGDPVTYLNWATFEPNFGPNRLDENYVVMNFENNLRHGQWHDVNERQSRGIIERTPVPDVGGTGAMLAAGLMVCGLMRGAAKPRR